VTRVVLITGGVRSGKSSLAERLAADYPQVAYIATCQALDGEMSSRIEAHQLHRPKHWSTIEEPLGLASSLKCVDTEVCVLIDCLGLWVTNCLLADEDTNLANPQRFIDLPPYKLGRVFRDCLGRVNSICAQEADDVYLCTAGLPLCLKRNGEILHG